MRLWGLVLLSALIAGGAWAQAPLSPVGMAQVEFADADGRMLDMLMLYPATPAAAAQPFRMALATNLHLFKDAPIAGGVLRPLVMFSHGAGGNGSVYAWFGEYLAARGYIVAMVYHYRANTYDSSALYVRNRIWQRPRDISRDITWLLHDKAWARHIDAGRIGVAGHSQGGFTALWLGGAQVDAGLFTAYQRGWKNNAMVPAYLRAQMRVDAAPAGDLRDRRVRAAFAMAPGDLPGFGMDAAGLARMAIPTYLIVGAGDTTTPPADNAGFAARHIPQARLEILPGPVGHEIFTNECDQLGRDNYPEGCSDAAGVDRAALHARIGEAALGFFDAALGVRRPAAR